MQESLRQIPLWILPIVAAVVLHEVAHGFAARSLGDPTAERAGRLTLNPLAHVDPLGTIVIPVFLLLSGTGFLFGWARPVPVNFANLRSPRWGTVLVAAAGPATNLVLAVASAALLHGVRALASAAPASVVRAVLAPLATMAEYGVAMNVFLGVFNLLPIPPLDGGRVVGGLLPAAASRQFRRIEPFGFAILVALMVSHTLGVIVGQPIRTLLQILL